MKLLSVSLVIIFAAQHAKSDSTSLNDLTRFAKRNAETLPDNEKKEGDECDTDSLTKFECENDRLRFCGPSNQIMSIPCVFNGRQGFCNCEKTACVPEKPVCSEKKSKCVQLNTKLPDNLDCHKYTYCNAKGEKLTLKCPGNLIFDPNVEKCMDRNTAKCNRIVCPRPGNMLQLIPFPQARNYYVLCYKGIGDVRKCSDDFYSVQNNTCQFDCKLRKDSGVFKDTNLQRCKDGNYYACTRAGTNFITVRAKCPVGLIFDENLGLCTETDTCSKSNNDSK